jgi:anti-anti-sigma factor
MAPISVTLAPRDPPAAVVALVGEHDTYSAGRLEAELGVLIDDGMRVVIDLRDTEFIDSTTLATLLAARREAEQAGLGFTFVLPERNYTEVNQLLDLTGLGSRFAIFETLEEALAAARGDTTRGDTVRSAA